MDQIFQEISKSIIDGNRELVVIKIKEAIENDIDVDQILQEGLIQTMMEVGLRFERGEFFVPEMLISARAMKSGLELLKPLLINASVEPVGKVIIGTVKGDLHDIGKNLVAIMLEGAGFDIMDLGVDVTPEEFAEAVSESSADILALSALLTTTLPNVENTIKLLVETGQRKIIKIMIGGAPVTDEYAESIGADGYATNAGQAVNVAKNLLN